MSLEHAEIPDERRLGRESLGPVTRLNRQLYLAVIGVLGTVLLVGVVGWLVLAARGKTMPDGLGVILGTVSGALVALVTDTSRR
jgi:hypothetical protein